MGAGDIDREVHKIKEKLLKYVKKHNMKNN
jgi:hypothetical protein